MWVKAVVSRGGIWMLTNLEFRRDFRFGIPIALGKTRMMPLAIKGQIISNLRFKRNPKFGV